MKYLIEINMFENWVIEISYIVAINIRNLKAITELLKRALSA